MGTVKPDDPDYLFDGEGAPDPDVAKLEAKLAPLRYQPRALDATAVVDRVATPDHDDAARDATVADAEAAVAAARRAFDAGVWATDTELRIRCLEQFHAALVEHRDELAALTIAEVGATPALCQGAQLDQPIEIVRYYADLLKTYPLTEDLGNIESRGMQHHRWVEKEAGGVVAAIIAYNYPNQLALAKLAPALAAGCTVVLKSAPDTPLVTLALGELIAKHTDIPAGVVNVLSGADPAVGAALTTSPDVDMVTFTGSTPTGRAIMREGAANLKRLTLELGGNDAAIVLPDADVDAIAPRIFAAAFGNSGQVCAAIKRLYVHESVHDALAARLAEMAAAATVGAGDDPDSQFGPLQNRKQFDYVAALADDARAAGGRFLTGGTATTGPGYFFPLSVLVDVTDGVRAVDEEQFGPILPIVRYHDPEDALARANANDNGLGGSVWSSDVERAAALAQRLQCGSVWVNDHSTISPTIPFGGAKQSGIGVEFGQHGLDEYTQLQTVRIPR